MHRGCDVMKKIFLGLAIVLFFCSLSSVFAAAYLSGITTDAARTGFIIGANAGYGKLNTPNRDIFSEQTWLQPYISSNQHYKIGYVVWGVNLGYQHALTPNLAIGFLMGYKDLGRSTYKGTITYLPPYGPETDKGDVKITQQTVDFLLSGQYFIYHGLNIFAQAGGALLRTYRKNCYSEETTGTLINNWSKTVYNMFPEAVFGIGYMFNNLNVYLMYDHIFHEVDSTTNLYAAYSKNGAPRYSYGFDGIFAGFTYTLPDGYITFNSWV